MSNANHCILGRNCKLAGTDRCTTLCPLFVGLHGANGKGGRIAKSNVPTDYYLKTITTSPARLSQPTVYATIDKYVQSFQRFFLENPTPKERIKNLYLWSANSGTGKTATASTLLNSFLIFYYLECLKEGRTPSPRPTYFLSMNTLQKDFLQMTRSGVPREIAEEAGERYYTQMEYAKQAELIVMDDVGTRSVTEAFRNDILDIIDTRQANQKPTIFTSNLPLEELPNLFQEYRLFDRIRDLAIVLEFEGTSNRGKRA